MSAMEIIALAASFSLLSGWRMYLTVFATGAAMYFNVLALPEHLASLDVLASPWVLAAAAAGFVAEFFADKIAWLDSAWDAVHSFIRPVGGALVALAIVDPSDQGWQIAVFLLGGGAALLSHGVKASTRTVVNASPEPFSNAVVSAGEDVATLGLVGLALADPTMAVVLAVALLVASIVAFFALRRLLRRLVAQMKVLGKPVDEATT